MRRVSSSAVAVALLAVAGLAMAGNTANAQGALRPRVSRFLAGVLAPTGNGRIVRWNLPPDRWNVPVCPLVAGLPAAAGALTLQRIATAAAQAHIRVAAKACQPNLYVVASDHPDRLLEKWWSRSSRMYQTVFGVPPVDRFIHSERPVRIWYNFSQWCTYGTRAGWRDFPGPIDPSAARGFDLPRCAGAPVRPTYGHPWSNITSALLVIDLRRTKDVTFRQLADFAALASLAGVRSHPDPGRQPSILQLFGPGTPPQGMTAWDRALLHALYGTSRWGPRQRTAVELAMVRRLSQQDPPN
jgi:hypothetical protein